MIRNQSYKRDLILNLIQHLGPISRSELINLTDYRPACIGEITKALLEEGILVEAGRTSVGHGRRRVLLEINSGHLCAIGIAFQPGSVLLLAASVDGTVLQQATFPAKIGMSREELMDLVAAQTALLLHTFRDKEILGIGIAEPLYDPTAYKPEISLLNNYLHYNDWVRLELKPRLEALSGLRVETYSGVVLPVLAERYYGVAKGVENFVNIELSNGIGCTICCNGTPVAGATGRAGELGHTVIDYGQLEPRMCFCGKPGCVEAVTAFPALVAQLQASLDQGVYSTLSTYMDPAKGITVEAIRQSLEDGDRLCMHQVKTAAGRLGVAIANVVNLLNPELVVLSGFMLGLGDFFLSHLEEAIRENTLCISGDFGLRISEAQDTALPLGAVAELFASYLNAENYKWVSQLRPSDLEEYKFTETED